MADYSSLTADDARSIGERFGLELVEVEPLSGGMTNSSFLASDGGGSYIVTVLDDHDVASATALASLMGYLAAAGVATPTPVTNPAGVAITTWSDTPVMVKHFVEGTLESPLAARHLSSVGELMARLHLVAPPPALAVGRRELPANWRAQLAGHGPDDLVALLTDASAHVEVWRHLPSGLIHGDLFEDNIVIAPDDHIVVLDWETASVEPFVLDLGMSAVGLCRTDNRLDRARLDTLLSGYQSVRPLHADEHIAIPTAIEYATALLAFNRFLRHNLHRPDDRKQDLYREMLDFAATLT